MDVCGNSSMKQEWRVQAHHYHPTSHSIKIWLSTEEEHKIILYVQAITPPA